ncbi:MAG: phosphatase PAP2 family protein [Eubacteriaceae bacterium]|jgi:undecaprenyl-diphosphatase
MNTERLILDFIQNNLRGDFLDRLMPMISAMGDLAAIWLILAIYFLLAPGERRDGWSIIFAVGIAFVCCSLILKPMVARIRPCDVNTTVQLLVSHPKDYSFPSGHTAASFAAVSALYFCRNKWWIPSLVLAVLIAFSRLYLYVHYPTDILAGALLGIAAGWAGCKIVSRIYSSLSYSRLRHLI